MYLLRTVLHPTAVPTHTCPALRSQVDKATAKVDDLKSSLTSKVDDLKSKAASAD